MKRFLLSLVFFTFSLTNVAFSWPNRLIFNALSKLFDESNSEITWDVFKKQNGRFYVTKDDTIRRNRFRDFQQRIQNHNSLFKRGESNFFTAINDFVDLVSFANINK